MNSSVTTYNPTTLTITTIGIVPRFPFTGKERDSETGYGYFGARYMDHELMTMWLSIDPMADKYPDISPYAYCAWNPVKLVDLDGREIWIGAYTDSKTRKYTPNSKANKTEIARMLDYIYNNSKAGKFVINSLVESDKKYYISNSADPQGNGNPDYTNADGKHRQIYLNKSTNVYTLSHELFHAFQHENKQWGASRSCEVEAFVFAGIVNSQINGGRFRPNLLSSGGQQAYQGVFSGSKECISYVCSMMLLTKSFNAKEMANAVSLFKNFSVEGSKYDNNRGYKYCLSGDRYNGSSSLLNQYKSSIY